MMIDPKKLKRLMRLLTGEDEWMNNVKSSEAAQELKNRRDSLTEYVRAIGRGGDLPLIVAIEKAIVEGDLNRHANSPMMASSLKTALAEIAVIEDHIAIVGDPAQYQIVNKAHSLPRNRRDSLPYDEARQALAGHGARLNNMDKARLDDDDKKLVDARRAAFQEAGKLYMRQQAKTLGLDKP